MPCLSNMLPLTCARTDGRQQACTDASQQANGCVPRAAQATKLGNVLFAYELQRRLGKRGVHSCAVDPGSVATNIYDGSLFSRQPLRWLIRTLYAPPSDGAAAVVHAACAPWERPARQQKGAGGTVVQQASKAWLGHA